MNRTNPTAVERRKTVWRTSLVLVAVAWMTQACVQVDGGAVELSWTLRTFEGNANTCLKSGVEMVRVCWIPLDVDGGSGLQVCRRGQFREFPCDSSRGVTRFELPPGRNMLFLEPVCAGGVVAQNFQVPAPIVRDVEKGGVVTLDQLLIVATDVRCSDARCSCP